MITFRAVLKISAALCLGILTVGCSSEPAAPQATTAVEKRNDFQIAEEVRGKIEKEPRLQGSAIKVFCNDGAVILSGTVTSREQFGVAQITAAGTKGARLVINRLQFTSPEQSAPAATPPSSKP